jgi:hypothetical protein
MKNIKLTVWKIEPDHLTVTPIQPWKQVVHKQQDKSCCEANILEKSGGPSCVDTLFGLVGWGVPMSKALTGICMTLNRWDTVAHAVTAGLGYKRMR